MKYLFFIFALSSILISCKKKEITTYHDDGSVQEVYAYKGDSLKHGKYSRFDPSGTLVEEATYSDGRLHGTRKIYENEHLIIQETYQQDTFHGAYKEFFPTGIIRLEGVYDHGVLKGIVKGYYETGELKEEVTFEDNQENGPFKEYYTNGNLKWEGTYRLGNNEFGVLKHYNEEGVLIKKMHCDDRAICTTTWEKE